MREFKINEHQLAMTLNCLVLCRLDVTYKELDGLVQTLRSLPVLESQIEPTFAEKTTVEAETAKDAA